MTTENPFGYQKLEKFLLNLRHQNRISGSLKEVLTIR